MQRTDSVGWCGGSVDLLRFGVCGLRWVVLPCVGVGALRWVGFGVWRGLVDYEKVSGEWRLERGSGKVCWCELEVEDRRWRKGAEMTYY